MKTNKFNNAIEAFECDFNLILEGSRTFAELDKLVEKRNESLLSDMQLLCELSFLLRHGRAEIHLIEEEE